MLQGYLDNVATFLLAVHLQVDEGDFFLDI